MMRTTEPLVDPPESEQAEPDAVEPEDVSLADVSDVVRSVRLFRARVSELIEDAVEKIACDIASRVLARELQLAPADVRKIVERSLQHYFDEEPLRIRAHEREVHRLECGIPVVADESLRTGDVVIELRNGAIDARLGVRLDAVLRSFS